MRLSAKFGLTVLGALAIGASTASAQAAHAAAVVFRPSVNVGVALPTGDTKTGMNTGFTVNGGVDLDMGMPIAWRGEVGYTRFGAKSDGSGVSGSLSDISGRANAVFKMTGTGMTPFLIGGVGIYRVKAEASQGGVSVSASENKFGWNVGGGIDLPLGGLASRIEARYHSVSMDGGNYTYIPITFGIRF